MRAAATMLAALAVALAAHAQPPVTATVDRTRVTVGKPFVFQITARGAQVGDPQIPATDDLVVEAQPMLRGQSTSIQIVNGRATSVVEMRLGFRASAQRAGTIKMPRVSVRVDGQDYMTDEFEIEAVEAGGAAAAPPAAAPAANAGAPQGRPGRDPTMEDVLQLEAEVDRKKVYQGEQVVLSLRILELNRVGVQTIHDGRNIKLPETMGFYAGQQLPVATRVEKRNGFDYMVQEFKLYLYPTGLGELVIGEWSWDGRLMAHTNQGPQMQRAHKTTKPILVESMPLPERRPGFTGAVGSFRARATVLDAEVAQGEPTQLEVRIEGAGNPASIDAPALPEIPWAHVGEAASEVEPPKPEQAGQMVKTFRYALTPLEAGQQSVPPIAFVYFEPRIGNYKTIEIAAIPVYVKPSADAGALVVAGGERSRAQAAVKTLGEDIVPIVTGVSALQRTASGAPLNAAASLVPPLLAAVLMIYARRRRRFAEDPAFARRHFARATGQRRLEGALRSREPAEDLYRAVADYLGDKLGAQAAGMTSADAQRALIERRAPEALAERFARVLKSCERARYAGAGLGPTELEALVHAAEQAMDELDAAMAPERRSWFG